MDPKTQAFLNIIAQLETSGGKNLNHQQMQQGLHAGDTALGRYGLMPNTILNVAAKMNAAGKLDEDTAPLHQIPKEQMQDYLQNYPIAEEKVANFLARNLLARNKGNEPAAAYSWHSGSELQPNDITKENLNSYYPQRYLNLKKEAQKKALSNIYSKK